MKFKGTRERTDKRSAFPGRKLPSLSLAMHFQVPKGEKGLLQPKNFNTTDAAVAHSPHDIGRVRRKDARHIKRIKKNLQDLLCVFLIEKLSIH